MLIQPAIRHPTRPFILSSLSELIKTEDINKTTLQLASIDFEALLRAAEQNVDTAQKPTGLHKVQASAYLN
jgi:hypothetical protein